MHFDITARPGALSPEELAALRSQVAKIIRGLFVDTIARAGARIISENLAGEAAYQVLREETLGAIATLDVLVAAVDTQFGDGLN